VIVVGPEISVLRTQKSRAGLKAKQAERGEASQRAPGEGDGCDAGGAVTIRRCFRPCGGCDSGTTREHG